MFGNFFKSGKDALNDLKNGALKFKEKKFLVATISGGFMVANADGNIDSDEKAKLLNFLKVSEELSVYGEQEIVTEFNKIKDTYDFDADAGDSNALVNISKIKGNEEKSKFLVRMICAIGSADGDFDNDEKKVVRRICNELDLSSSQFEL